MIHKLYHSCRKLSRFFFRKTYIYILINVRRSGASAQQTASLIVPFLRRWKKHPRGGADDAAGLLAGSHSGRKKKLPPRRCKPLGRESVQTSYFKQVGSNNKEIINARGYLARGVLLITLISWVPHKISPATVSPVSSNRLYAPTSRGRLTISAMSNLATNWPRLSACQD